MAGAKTSGGNHEIAAGTLINNRYRIERRLGSGGMGSVYLAKDEVLSDELIAIKILHSDLIGDDRQMQRFLREVQLMRRVNQPNVVRTFDVGSDGDLAYFTMEFVPGRPLEDWAGDGSYPLEQIPKLIIEICGGLEAIHKAGVIHRDLKPANILVLKDSSIKITDFGVARPEYSELTAHNEIVGSALYIAPEVWLGTKMTPSVDLYSLGVMLYELVTGTLPFQGDSPAVMMRMHLEYEPEPPKELNSKIPPWLNKLILKLLAKSESDRPRDAREVIEYVKLHGGSGVREVSAHGVAANAIASNAEEPKEFLQRLEKLTSQYVDAGRAHSDPVTPPASEKVAAPNARARVDGPNQAHRASAPIDEERKPLNAKRFFDTLDHVEESAAQDVSSKSEEKEQASRPPPLMNQTAAGWRRPFSEKQLTEQSSVPSKEALALKAFAKALLKRAALLTIAMVLFLLLPSALLWLLSHITPSTTLVDAQAVNALMVMEKQPGTAVTLVSIVIQGILFIVKLTAPLALVGACAGSLTLMFRLALRGFGAGMLFALFLFGFVLFQIHDTGAIHGGTLASIAILIRSQLAQIMLADPYFVRPDMVAIGGDAFVVATQIDPTLVTFPACALAPLYLMWISILMRRVFAGGVLAGARGVAVVFTLFMAFIGFAPKIRHVLSGGSKHVSDVESALSADQLLSLPTWIAGLWVVIALLALVFSSQTQSSDASTKPAV